MIVGTSFRTNKKIAAVAVMAVVVAEELTSVVFGRKEHLDTKMRVFRQRRSIYIGEKVREGHAG